MKKISLTIAIVFVIVMGLAAQPNSGDPGGGVRPGEAPITGIEYLLGIGGLYGIRRLMKRKSFDKD